LYQYYRFEKLNKVLGKTKGKKNNKRTFGKHCATFRGGETG
jgi:hypothetical protein